MFNSFPKPEELENKIRKWLEKHKTVTITTLHDEKNHFILSFKNSQKPDDFIAIQIRYSKVKPDVLTIGWSWGFSNEDISMFNNIDNKTKIELQNKITGGFLLMNLSINLIPSIHNLQKIACFKMVYLDGLSEDRLIDILDKVIKAYHFTLRKFDEYLKFPDTFNPEDLT